MEVDARRVAVREQGDAGAAVGHVEAVDDLAGQLHRAVVVDVRAARHVEDEGDVDVATTSYGGRQAVNVLRASYRPVYQYGALFEHFTITSVTTHICSYR